MWHNVYRIYIVRKHTIYIYGCMIDMVHLTDYKVSIFREKKMVYISINGKAWQL